jgi:hypothetical protein
VHTRNPVHEMDHQELETEYWEKLIAPVWGRAKEIWRNVSNSQFLNLDPFPKSERSMFWKKREQEASTAEVQVTPLLGKEVRQHVSTGPHEFCPWTNLWKYCPCTLCFSFTRAHTPTYTRKYERVVHITSPFWHLGHLWYEKKEDTLFWVIHMHWCAFPLQ